MWWHSQSRRVTLCNMLQVACFRTIQPCEQAPQPPRACPLARALRAHAAADRCMLTFAGAPAATGCTPSPESQRVAAFQRGAVYPVLLLPPWRVTRARYYAPEMYIRCCLYRGTTALGSGLRFDHCCLLAKVIVTCPVF